MQIGDGASTHIILLALETPYGMKAAAIVHAYCRINGFSSQTSYLKSEGYSEALIQKLKCIELSFLLAEQQFVPCADQYIIIIDNSMCCEATEEQREEKQLLLREIVSDKIEVTTIEFQTLESLAKILGISGECNPDIDDCAHAISEYIGG